MSQDFHRSTGELGAALERWSEPFGSGSDIEAGSGVGEPHPESNGHLAQIYESREEHFSVAIQFLREGLERGERCLYIGDGHTREELLSVMQERGLDLEAGFGSGALTFHAFEEITDGAGAFDPDEAISFVADTTVDATEEYAGLRITLEPTECLEDGECLEGFLEYEATLNTHLEEADCSILCQYDRERCSPETLLEVIRTHPELVYGTTTCHNVYYTRPEEFRSAGRPGPTVERMLDTLVEQTRSTAEFETYKQFLQELNDVTASPDRSFEEKLQVLFELGCEYFGLELGALARVDTDEDWFEVEYASDDHEHFRPGVELPLSETYCTAAAEIKDAASVSDPQADGYDDITVYQEFGIRAYLGTYIRVDGSTDRTFFFITSDPRDQPFPEEARTFLQVMGQWVKAELKREQREREQQWLYELAADTDRPFEEKLEELFDIGRERFDLDVGAIARIDPSADLLEVEYVGGDHDHEHLEAGTRVALSKTYCRVLGDRRDTAGIADPADAGVGDRADDAFGFEAYLGTRIELETAPDRSLFFASFESRAEEFSEADHTFVRLMGQWVNYELERQHRQREEQATLDRIHTLTTETVRTLVDPTTREELERTVCDQLVDSPLYTDAWIGDLTDDGAVSTRTGTIAEDDIRLLTDGDAASGGTGGLAQSVGANVPQIVRRIQEVKDEDGDGDEDKAEQEDNDSELAKVAGRLGWEAVVVLPLTFAESNYGALVVCSDRPGAFGDREQAALETLVDVVGFRIYAHKQEQLLLADPVVEIELRATDSSALIATLASELDCECRLDSVTTDPGETTLQFYTVATGTEPDRVREVAASHGDVDQCRIIEANGECTIEVRARPTCVLNRLVTAGAAVRTAVADPDGARIVVDVAPDDDIREITAAVRDHDPAWTVAAKQQADRPARTVGQIRTSVEELLTAKQRRALETAYHAGYYDYPRKSTAEEIASILEISDATLFQHLQAAQHKLLTAWLQSTDDA